MHRAKLLGKLTLSALLLFSANSHAEIVKYNFTAQGYSLTWGPSCGRFDCPPLSVYGDHHLATMLNPTSTVTGSFFYDTDLPVRQSPPGSDYSAADYTDAKGIGSSLTADTGYHYASDPAKTMPNVQIFDYLPDARFVADNISITTGQKDSYGATNLLSIDFRSKVGNGLLSNTDLPTSLSLDNFNGGLSLFWSNSQGGYQFFYANITSLTLVPAPPVPEPATYAMFGIGLAGIGLAKRRQRGRQAA